MDPESSMTKSKPIGLVRVGAGNVRCTFPNAIVCVVKICAGPASKGMLPPTNDKISEKSNPRFMFPPLNSKIGEVSRSHSLTAVNGGTRGSA